MILFDLICDSDHQFEGWFKNSAAFDEQKQAGHLMCPVCESTEIRKGIMAPNIVIKKGAVAKPKQNIAPTPKVSTEVVEVIKKMRDYVEKNCEYVGNNFPEEARRIHYKEPNAKKKGIYGESTLKETKELVDEGIDLAPVLWQNKCNS
jgi:hypothetical protein